MLAVMFRVRIQRVAAAVAMALVLHSADADGQEAPTSRLGANVSRAGNVSLIFIGKPGSTVYFDERIGGVVKRFGSSSIGPAGYTVIPEATVWRCDRLVRRFEATEVQVDGSRAGGSFDVRTDSCAQRFKLSAPARVGLGSVVRMRVLDRWSIGGMRTAVRTR